MKNGSYNLSNTEAYHQKTSAQPVFSLLLKCSLFLSSRSCSIDFFHGTLFGIFCNPHIVLVILLSILFVVHVRWVLLFLFCSSTDKFQHRKKDQTRVLRMFLAVLFLLFLLKEYLEPRLQWPLQRMECPRKFCSRRNLYMSFLKRSIKLNLLN